MFIDEIIEKFDLDFVGVVDGFRILNINNKFILISSQTKISEYTNFKIVLQCKKQQIYIYGQDLKIVDLSNTQTVIKGKIFIVGDREIDIAQLI